jgi:hypothetical protein
MITSGNSYKHLHPRLTGRAGQTVVFSTVCLGFNLIILKKAKATQNRVAFLRFGEPQKRKALLI